MVGTGHVLAFCLLIGLPSLGWLIARKHDSPGWPGFLMGVAAFVALLSGNFLRLLVLDLFDRKRYLTRKGVGPRVATLALITFLVSVVGSVALYRRVTMD